MQRSLGKELGARRGRRLGVLASLAAKRRLKIAKGLALGNPVTNDLALKARFNMRACLLYRAFSADRFISPFLGLRPRGYFKSPLRGLARR